MDARRRSPYPLVVVGAGPAGLTTALTVARQGVEVLLVDKHLHGLELPRATVLSTRTMEMLRAWDLENAIRAGGNDVDMAMLQAPTAARAGEGVRFDVGYPNATQSSLVSPTGAAAVPQDHLETVLREELRSQPSATLALGVEAVDVATGRDCATVTLLDHRSGEHRSITATYVVAADGARSRVRSALGIDMVGSDGVLAGAQVEFHAPLWPVVGAHRYLLYDITTPGGTGLLLPAGRGDRWLFGLSGAPDALASTPRELLRRRIEIASGVPGMPVRITRVGGFSSGAQLAHRFSVGNVFLVGDAAHRISPRGGTGLNTAIGDGRDLGWKLSWVLREWAPPALLSTYEAERRPPVVHNMARSADPMGSRRDVSSELDVDLGGRIRHAWIGPHRSTVDALGPGLTLLTGPDGSPWAPAAGSAPAGPPLTQVPLPAMAARTLGISPTGALLVRPDGVPVAGWWTATDAERNLRHAVASFAGQQQPDSTDILRSA